MNNSIFDHYVDYLYGLNGDLRSKSREGAIGNREGKAAMRVGARFTLLRLVPLFASYRCYRRQ
jgi:hypothetical protein